MDDVESEEEDEKNLEDENEVRKKRTLIFWVYFFKKVTHAQCGNFRIFLPFRFYVKSIFEILEVLKVLFCHFVDVELCWFGTFQPSKSAKYAKNQNSVPENVLEWQIALIESTKIDFT